MDRRLRTPLCSSFVAALLLTPGCGWREDGAKTTGKTGSDTAAKESSKGKDEVNKESPIGTATMTEDGTITLDLRAGAHGRLVYRKGDKGYAEVLNHLGGLKPGESKLVRPWPDHP
jgi:hypothetical protein